MQNETLLPGKNATATPLKIKDYCHVLNPKADNQLMNFASNRYWAPNHRLPDVTVRPENHLPDPEIKTTHDNWYAHAWEVEFGEVVVRASTEEQQKEATITEIEDNADATTESEMEIKLPPTTKRRST